MVLLTNMLVKWLLQSASFINITHPGPSWEGPGWVMFF